MSLLPAVRYVHELLDANLDRRTDATAVIDSRGTWTYRELATLADRLQHWMARRGIQPGDRVLAALPSNVFMAALMYACSAQGAIFVPVPASIRPARLEAVIADCEPAVALLDDSARHELVEDLGSDVAPRMPRTPHEVAFLMYTSGSSATPKGVICPHSSVLAAVEMIAARLEYRASDVVYCTLPLSFDYGLYQLLLSAHAGCGVALDSDTPLLGQLDAAARVQATVLPLVPATAGVLGFLAARKPALAPVRLITTTGGPLGPTAESTLRSAFGTARLCLMYGLTECKRVAINHTDEEPLSGAVGLPLDGTEVTIQVEDAHGAGDQLSTVHHAIGEIVVRGRHVMAGYWRDPDLTASRFRPDPVSGVVRLHTGDRGYLDQNGHVHVLGRIDGVFKRMGVRMSIEEIEAAAQDIAGVRDVMLLPADPDGGDMVLAVVGEVRPRDVLDALRDLVGPERTPRVCHVMDALPLTPNGKPDRRALAEALSRETLSRKTLPRETRAGETASRDNPRPHPVRSSDQPP